MAMEKYGERITVTGSPEFKAQIIRSAADAQLPITFTDPGLERRRLALIEQGAKPDGKRPGAHVVQVPPPQRRHGLRTLGQVEGLRMDGGEIARPQAPRPAAISEQEQRKAKLRADMEAKKAKRQGKGRGR
jgi:hypothetical protein